MPLQPLASDCLFLAHCSPSVTHRSPRAWQSVHPQAPGTVHMPKFQPPGWHTLTPRIVVPDHQRFVQFLHDVFDAYGKTRPNAPTELRIGDSLILISEGGGLRESMPAFLYVYVEDTDATYTRAITAGAVSLEAHPRCTMATAAPWSKIPGATSGRSPLIGMHTPLSLPEILGPSGTKGAPHAIPRQHRCRQPR